MSDEDCRDSAMSLPLGAATELPPPKPVPPMPGTDIPGIEVPNPETPPLPEPEPPNIDDPLPTPAPVREPPGTAPPPAQVRALRASEEHLAEPQHCT